MAALMIYRNRNHRIGRPSAIFLLLYAMMRFGIEFFRGDDIRGFFGPLSTSQWISIATFIAGTVLLLRKTAVLEPLDNGEALKFEVELREKEKAEKAPQTKPADEEKNDGDTV